MRCPTVSQGLACLALFVALSTQAQAGPVFGSASYSADIVFQDQLSSTTMTLAYDGTNYWSSSGGGNFGVREARYNSSGGLTGTFSPGLDFRSIFTDASGNVFARQYSDNRIFSQTSPGTFALSGVTLTGGFLDAQSSVVRNGAGEYVAFSGGTLSRWSSSGTSLGSVTFSGYGSVSGENTYPQNRGVIAVGAYYLTYNNGILYAWNSSGVRVDQTILTGAGNTFDSDFSLSYANGRVFIVDAAGGNWRGFNVGIASGNPVPAPAGLILLATAAPFGAYFGWRRRKQLAVA